MKPRAFVGSSKEGLRLANAIQELLDADAEVIVWNQGIFELSSTVLDDLLDLLESLDFGIFVFSPDDVIQIRERQYSAVRDNVLFEFGLFTGRLGKRRCFAVIPAESQDLRLPSDLLGLTPATYDPSRAKDDVLGALGPACNKLRRTIEKQGAVARSPKPVVLTEGTSADQVAVENPREVFIRGARRVQTAISRAFGPNGSYFSVSVRPTGSISHKNGSVIAGSIRSAHPLEQKGVELMARVARSARESVGDGSKTAVLLAFGILKGGHDLIEQGLPVKDVIRGMKSAVEIAIDSMKPEKIGIRAKDLMNVSTTAATGERALGGLVAEAIDKVGKDGVIAIEPSDSIDTFLEVREGTKFDRGYVSDMFLTDPYGQKCVLQDCYILIHENRISSFRDLLPVAEEIAKTGSSLLVIADDIEGEALATLVTNKLRGTLKACAVKAPGFDAKRRALLGDLAIISGGRAITRDLGMKLESVRLVDLGRAREVVVDAQTTTLFEGGGKPKDIETRAGQIRASIERAPGPEERDFLFGRLANLVGGVGVLHVGGRTEEERVDNLYKVGSALSSARLAIEQGLVPGGGAALLRAATLIDKVENNNESELAGLRTVSGALRQPIVTLLESSKLDLRGSLSQIAESTSSDVGFNAEDGRIENLVNAGVVDAARVLLEAIEIAFAHIKVVLQTGEWDLSDRDYSSGDVTIERRGAT